MFDRCEEKGCFFCEVTFMNEAEKAVLRTFGDY